MADAAPSIPVQLRGDGVLWLINKVVFHPRGFALAVDADGDLSLLGDGDEPWQFTEELDREAFAQVEALLARARAHA